MSRKIRSNSINNKHPVISVPIYSTSRQFPLPPLRRPSYETSFGTSRNLAEGKDSAACKSANYSSKVNPSDVLRKGASMDTVESLTQKFQIRFLSNWGDPSIISCSDILFLDDNHRGIPILSITGEPMDIRKTNLQQMITGMMYKTSMDECWKASWENRYPIEITVIIENIGRVSQIRFFNCEIQGKSGVREVEVIQKDKLLWKGEITPDFGIVATLDSRKFEQIEKCQSQAPEIVFRKMLSKDEFGVLPQCSFQNFRFLMHANYGHESLYGLNNMMFFDNFGVAIPKGHISISISGCELKSEIQSIIRDNYHVYNQDSHIVFERTDSIIKPTIEATVIHPHIVGGVVIANHHHPMFQSNISVKYLSIYSDNHFIWSGRIKYNGEVPDFKQDPASTVIYFSNIVIKNKN